MRKQCINTETMNIRLICAVPCKYDVYYQLLMINVIFTWYSTDQLCVYCFHIYTLFSYIEFYLSSLIVLCCYFISTLDS